MIERFVYKQLPALYEVQMNSDSGGLQPAHERVVVMAETLDEHEVSREDVVMSAVIHKAQTEGIDDLAYSLRLMRPKETRAYLIPKLRWAMIRATEDSIFELPPVKRLTQLAVGHMAILSGIVKDPVIKG